MLEHERQISDYKKSIAQLKDQNKVNGILTDDEIIKLEKKLDLLKEQVYSQLTPWERVTICRHPDRPRSIDYIKNLCESFTEIFGDRLFQDDHSIVAGLGVIDDEKFVIIAQEKGCDTESRLYRNFGMPHPEGYRKALRLMKLAAKFNLPVLSLLDTPGAFPGLAAEERGQGSAIATNLMEMANLPTPIIVMLIGEGCSGGALGMGVGDVIGMLEHAYYSVIAPEGCASILWRDTSKKEEAAAALRMQAEDLLEFGVVDEIIREPQGGAHYDPKVVYEGVKRFILKQSKILKKFSHEELLERRYQKFRKMGAYTSKTELV
ncbi:MAG: Acetyl-coenzyme A carboxylase carboxyl transferase subunit alpha [Chlamydiae bacterium]|nr:Acetyl-coenzyme A carboxylase carboxyl transferase subunit alpha [Chlamydiota bacterium]